MTRRGLFGMVAGAVAGALGAKTFREPPGITAGKAIQLLPQPNNTVYGLTGGGYTTWYTWRNVTYCSPDEVIEWRANTSIYSDLTGMGHFGPTG